VKRLGAIGSVKRVGLVGWAASLVLLATPAAAVGQEVSSTESVPVAPPAEQAATVSKTLPAPEDSAKDGPRFRFGIAGAVAGGRASGVTSAGTRVSSAVLGPGLQLDLGAQLRRDLAVFVRGEGASILWFSGASAYLVAEWTPIRLLSVGTGLGADTMVGPYFAAGDCPAGSYCPPERTGWTGLSVPLVVGLQLIDAADWEGHRRTSALRLGLEVAAGVEPRSWVFGWHANLTAGFVLR